MVTTYTLQLVDKHLTFLTLLKPTPPEVGFYLMVPAQAQTILT
jgi:hypothetical protein